MPWLHPQPDRICGRFFFQLQIFVDILYTFTICIIDDPKNSNEINGLGQFPRAERFMLIKDELPMLENRVFRKTIKLCILATSIMCTSLFAAPILTALPPLTVDVTGVPSFDVYGDPGNTVLNFNVGANTTVTTLTFDVQLTAYFYSWLSEMDLRIGNSTQTTGVIFTPGAGDDISDTKTYTGIIDLAALDLAFNVGRDGILRLEFYESFKDLTTGYPDGRWDAGTVTFGLAHLVPEPDSYPLAGIALLALALNLRRRRNHGATV